MEKLKNKTIIFSVIILVIVVVIGMAIIKVKTQKSAPWEEMKAEILAGIGPIRDGAKEFLPANKKGFVDEIGGFSTDGKTFYFFSDRNNPGIQCDIFSYSTETRKATPIITDTGNKQILAWSPQGEKIIYSLDADSTNINESYGYSDIFIASSDGNNKKLLFSEASSPKPLFQEIAFSPDGEKIAFSDRTAGEQNRSIYILDLNTGKIKRLADQPGNNLSWSPDGRYLVYYAVKKEPSSDSYLNQIYTISIEDGSVKDLNIVGTEPRWSPDGKWIAFVRQIEKTIEIYIIPSQGGEAIQVTEGSGFNAHWSPDGERIIFNSFRNGANIRTFSLDVTRYLSK